MFLKNNNVKDWVSGLLCLLTNPRHHELDAHSNLKVRTYEVRNTWFFYM